VDHGRTDLGPAMKVHVGDTIRWEVGAAVYEGAVWSPAPGGGYWVTVAGRYVAVRRQRGALGGWVEYQPKAAR